MTRNRKIHIIISWILVVVCMAIIFYLSSQIAEKSQNLSDSFLRKILEYLGVQLSSGFIRTVAHCLEFTGLSLLIFNAVYVTWEHKRVFLIAFLSTVAYAMTDEIHQLFVPGRAFQIIDILVDSTGAFLGALASLIILKVILTVKERGNKNGSIEVL